LEGIQTARAGAAILDVHRRTVEVIKTGLLKLGLLTDVSGEQYRIWYTHGASHYIGIDVHDVGDRSHPLERAWRLPSSRDLHPAKRARRAPHAGKHRLHRKGPARRAKVRTSACASSSFLLEESGLSLSSALPKTIDDIEALMKRRDK
jgi:Xaa-Pro aminopeptidase